MKKNTRQQIILELIKDADQQELVSTKDLAQNFDVSEATIRRDLQELANAGIIHRQHGGVLSSHRPTVQDKGQIGLLFGSRIDKFRDPFYNLVLEGVDRKLQQFGYRSAYVKTFYDVQTPEQAKELLKTYLVDGIIIIGTSDVESIQYLLDAAPHIVTISHQPERHADLINFDGEFGMKAVVEHVLACGYRRLGFITGGRDTRLKGYIDTHETHNLAIDPDLIHIFDNRFKGWTPEAGERGTKQLMSLKNPPDAIVCASDRLAIGALHWLRQHKYRIPDDLAVTGFDNIPDSEFTFPPLTTVHVHKELMGELAVEQLVRRIENPQEVPLHITTPTALVVRESCAKRHNG